MRLIPARHEDNPMLFKRDGTPTAFGTEYLDALDQLTGPRYKRLRCGLWVAAGFSGHGFMIAPAVGRVVADALLTGAHDPALEAFALDRFSRGSIVPELQIV